MHLLLMSSELEQLQRALDNYPPDTTLTGPSLRATLQSRLQAAHTHPGYTRAELCRWSGWHKTTLLKKMAALEIPPPTHRNEHLDTVRAVGLLAPQLTIFPDGYRLPANRPIRLVTPTLMELNLLRLALADWPDPSDTNMIEHLRKWLDMLADTRATLPYPLVVADWAKRLQQYEWKGQPDNAALATRRGLFYRTKIAPGILHLAEPAPRHLDRCHVYASDVARLSRNTRVMLTAGMTVPRYGPASRFLPPVETTPIDRPAGANADD